MNIVKLADKYSKLRRLSSPLNIFNNSAKIVKEVCKESESEFWNLEITVLAHPVIMIYY